MIDIQENGICSIFNPYTVSETAVIDAYTGLISNYYH